MQAFIVGGAVRDALLQQPVQDRDWVVVGATPQALIDQGFLPVGRDFPVFLHPQTREEVALARTERKTAKGYHGFAFHAAPDVTLHEDLMRRDLTINAMAVPAPLGSDWAGQHLDASAVIDPYGGRADLANKTLRHVSDAFAEDPVRILRIARFAARWPDFVVAPETQTLMQSMVQDGEVDALVPERVWQELSRGLMCDKPSKMFEVLRACGALQVLLPELNALWGVPQRAEYHPEVDTGVHAMLVLDMAAQLNAPLDVRFACLCHDLGKGTTPKDVLPRHIGHEGRSVKLLDRVAKRWKVPSDAVELARIVAAEHGNIHRSSDLGADAVMRLLERCDALRRPERFAHALLACECDARGRTGFEQNPYPQRERLQQMLHTVLQVDTAIIAKNASLEGFTGFAIGGRIRQARVQSLKEAFFSHEQSHHH